MLVGIGFIAILTGAIAERFLAGEASERAYSSRPAAASATSSISGETSSL